MGTLRAATTPALPQIVNITENNSSGRNPIAVSLDRKRIYLGGGDYASNNLYESTDEGATTVLLKTFQLPGAITARVRAIVETDDGEALVSTSTPTGQSVNVTGAQLWKSSGWGGRDGSQAQRQAATWTQVLDVQLGGVYFRGAWCINRWALGPDGEIMVCMYGPQTGTAVGSGGVVNGQTEFATKVYRSTDHGATWAVVMDLATRFPGQAGIHCHAIAYDPIWDMWWLTAGDNYPDEPGEPVGSGAYKTMIFYAHGEDVRENGAAAVWTRVPIPKDDQVTEYRIRYQSTSIAIFPDAIVFGCDSPPFGINRIARRGYRVMGPIHTVALTHATNAISDARGLAIEAAKPVEDGLPVMLSLQQTAPSGSDFENKVIATRDGVDFYEVYSRPVQTGAGAGVVHGPHGPTLNGKIVYTNTDAAAANRVVAELLWPIV